jgi:hypothetical protein
VISVELWRTIICHVTDRDLAHSSNRKSPSDYQWLIGDEWLFGHQFSIIERCSLAHWSDTNPIRVLSAKYGSNEYHFKRHSVAHGSGPNPVGVRKSYTIISAITELGLPLGALPVLLCEPLIPLCELPWARGYPVSNCVKAHLCVRALVFSARRCCRRSRVRAPVGPGTFLRRNIIIFL